MIIDIEPGHITIREAEPILDFNEARCYSLSEVRDIADQLDADGEHTCAADGLRRAADQAEKGHPHR